MPSIKPALHPLQTPRTMVFPSELQSDSGSSSLTVGNGRADEALSTPITPPVAYTEFLKKFQPILSPITGEPDFSKIHTLREGKSTPSNSPTSQPASQPASAVSGTFHFTGESSRSATASLPPPTPCTAPPIRRDPRSLRALRIPPPPRYAPMIEAPRSATTLASPFSASPYSASPYSASPSDWRMRYWDGPHSAIPSGRFTVRHVITHTITFKRTQLDDPPKGKRRKREGSNEP
ncbi:hypothetical protein BDV28DRAFT_130705 [Aspergillus coremiiformis]|uniref:Uncharacterized protein n=1 Tax=Aspergillus coremiiformis TaxID=138285 RepID=A0A5N6ZAT5_9EURO|nr:hypothetical protein BDV28DRAFT_130705 [Aspergillus coremiiformis]